MGKTIEGGCVVRNSKNQECKPNHQNMEFYYTVDENFIVYDNNTRIGELESLNVKLDGVNKIIEFPIMKKIEPLLKSNLTRPNTSSSLKDFKKSTNNQDLIRR